MGSMVDRIHAPSSVPPMATMIIGARASALSRIQADLVGKALRAVHPRLELEFRFVASAGDRNLAADLSAVLRAGGFTSELSAALTAGEIDIAVHSWKDLPFSASPTTCIAATLPRADARDVLLVKRDWLAQDRDRIRVLTCSARRRINLADFLTWALPNSPPDVQFAAVRGDILRRIEALHASDADALVIAKAALDRLLTADGDAFAAVRAHLHQRLERCELMVLPLSQNPAAPGQGALALELRRDREDLRHLLGPIHDAASFDRVARERASLAATGDEDYGCGISIVAHEAGEIEYRRGTSLDRASPRDTIALTTLTRHESPLPRAAERSKVWVDDETAAGEASPLRTPHDVAHKLFADRRSLLLVARADALPNDYVPPPGQIVWTAGIDTWRKLAARGVWVHGSDDGLGEGAARDCAALFPHVSRSIKLSHTDGFDSEHSERIATYRVTRTPPEQTIRDQTHFYWRSGSRFLEALRAVPRLREAWHGCGLGNSLRTIRSHIGPERVRAFLSAEQFRREVLG
jgi:hydroxymethylbilane synthase